jgi:hypothetical protein
MMLVSGVVFMLPLQLLACKLVQCGGRAVTACS